jgi:methionyl-tRNA formyltransferase
LGAELLIRVLPQWLSGAIKPIQQDGSLATYTKILAKEDGKIDWKKSAKEIDRQIRAFEDWPGTWTEWPTDGRKIKIKIIKAEVLEGGTPSAPGKVSVTKDGEMMVACNQGSLKISEMQLEGKNKTTGKEFLRGYPEIIGATLI